MTTNIGPCDVCGEPARGPLCGRCKTAAIGADDALKVLAVLGLAEPTEWKEKRLARLSPMARFMVGVMIESWERSGAPVTLSEAISQIEEAKEGIERRQR